ncbi:MAG: hypothetical protein OIF50_00900 [Flavobacteriaceae bacterium]|nr:hypothetical protein [Flavobacteriaceae bacterium]
MKTLTKILLLFICSNAIQCQKVLKTTDTIGGSNEYKLAVPEIMEQTTALNDIAKLQYQNPEEELYVIVIDEDKENFKNTYKRLNKYNENISATENYREIQIQQISKGIKNPEIQSTTNKQFKGCAEPSPIVQMDGNNENINLDVAYYISFAENKDKVYMIMAWTLKDFKNKHHKTLNNIVSSFEIL